MFLCHCFLTFHKNITHTHAHNFVKCASLPLSPLCYFSALPRGMVQLFNAVRKHQKNMDEKMKEVGGSERKRAKLLSSVSKKDFIDVLRGTESTGDKGSRVDRKVVRTEMMRALVL